MLRTIHFHGDLGKRFGRTHKVDVASPAEAIRAFSALFPGFRQFIHSSEWRLVKSSDHRIKTGAGIEHENDLHLRMGRWTHLHLIPVAKGRKRGGVGKIILGAVLLVAAIATAGAAMAGFITVEGVSAGAGATLGQALGASMVGVPGLLSVGSVALMGVSMIFAGVSQMLSAQKSTPPQDQKTSFLLSGPVNTTAQGAPVPLIYGQVRVGSIVAASALVADEYGTQHSVPQLTGKTGMSLALTGNK